VTHTEASTTPGVPTPEKTTTTATPDVSGQDLIGQLNEKRYSLLSEEMVPPYPDSWPPTERNDGSPPTAYYQLPSNDPTWKLCDVGTSKNSLSLLSKILSKSEVDLKENASCAGQAAPQGGMADPTGEVSGASLYSIDIEPFNWFKVTKFPQQGRRLNLSVRSDGGGGAAKLVEGEYRVKQFNVKGINGFQTRGFDGNNWFQIVSAVVDCPNIKGAQEHGISRNATITATVNDLINNQERGKVSQDLILKGMEEFTPDQDTALREYVAGICLVMQGN